MPAQTGGGNVNRGIVRGQRLQGGRCPGACPTPGIKMSVVGRTCKLFVSRRHAVWQCRPHRTYVDMRESWVASRRHSRSYRLETGRRSPPSASCEQTWPHWMSGLDLRQSVIG